MSAKAKEYIKTIKNFSVNRKVNDAADLLGAEVYCMAARITELEKQIELKDGLLALVGDESLKRKQRIEDLQAEKDASDATFETIGKHAEFLEAEIDRLKAELCSYEALGKSKEHELLTSYQTIRALKAELESRSERVKCEECKYKEEENASCLSVVRCYKKSVNPHERYHHYEIIFCSRGVKKESGTNDVSSS